MKNRVLFVVLLYLISVILFSHAFSQELMSLSEIDKLTSRLSDDESERLMAIIITVAADPYEPTFNTKAEFNNLLRKMNMTSREYEDFKYTVIASTAETQILYWEDVLVTLKKKRPYRSKKRWKLEKKLLDLNILQKERWVENNRIMQRIAKGEIIEGYKIDTAIAWQVLSARKDAKIRINRLFE